MSLATKNTPGRCPVPGCRSSGIVYLEADKAPPRVKGVRGGGHRLGARYAVCGAGHRTKYEECPE